MIKDIILELYVNTYFSIGAGFLSLVFYNRFNSFEGFIVPIIWINVSADVLATAFTVKGITSEVIYNFSTPLEQLLTLYLYSKGDKKAGVVNVHRVSIVIIVLLSLTNYVIIKNPYGFHYYTFIISGIIVAVFSYWQLKSSMQESLPWRSVILWFSGANLIYYSLMVSSVSSMPLANDISTNLALSIKTVNDVGYIIWSILISVGILWNKKKNI